MKRKLGIAVCGLACCLCSENDVCGGCASEQCPDRMRCENRKCAATKGVLGCWQCEADCRKGMLKKTRPYAFVQFIKRYGEEALLDCLAYLEANGVAYHREGLSGDYDRFEDAEQIIAFLLQKQD